MKKREKGFALMTVLVFFLVLLILGVGGAIITQMGYFSIASEAKYSVAEKNANKGLMKALENRNCTNFQGGSLLNGYIVKAFNDTENNYCFAWAEGWYMGAKVVKTSIFSLQVPWAAAIYKNLNSTNILGSAAIVGYDPEGNSCSDNDSCIGYALITGNPLNLSYNSTPCYTDPQNFKGLISTKTPYVNDETLLQTDLTSKLFNAGNRTQLLEKLSQAFQVNFNNGTPTGLVNPEINLPVNSCTAEGNTITCGTGKDADKFTWDNSTKAYIYNKDNNYYSKIDFGNAQITFMGKFEGGGYIAGGNITFSGDVNPTSSLVLVARDKITLSHCKINISNTFMFSKNYYIEARHSSTIKNGIIYSGGPGGELEISIKGGCCDKTSFGTIEEPILIISDNNLEGINTRCGCGEGGNGEFWGAIFVTDANNNFNLEGKGNLSIHGVIISSSNSNNINLRGNFELRFNFKVLKNLYKNLSQFNLLRNPVCLSKKNLFTLFTMRTY